MAALPKVDSIGLRLAKTVSAERVSSVSTVSKEDLGRTGRERTVPARTDEAVNGRATVPPSDRRSSDT
jgi:hypothetical protein